MGRLSYRRRTQRFCCLQPTSVNSTHPPETVLSAFVGVEFAGERESDLHGRILPHSAAFPPPIFKQNNSCLPVRAKLVLSLQHETLSSATEMIREP